MKLISNITVVAGIYHVSVGLFGDRETAFTPVEAEALAVGGEPMIEVGGEFTDGELTFTLAERDLQFPTQFPVTIKFSKDDFDDAKERATLWWQEIEERLDTAMTDLRTEVAENNNAGTFVNTIDTTPAP